MNRETSSSREIPRTRADLAAAIGREARLQQNATDAVDEVFAQFLGVNRTDVRVLDLLDLHGPMTAGELADRAGVTTGAVTAILDRLTGAGYLRRVRDDADRRKVYVELTEEATRIASEFYAPIATRGTEMLMRHSVDDLRTILDAVRGGRELSETFAAEMRARAPRRNLADAVRTLKDEARSLKTEWAEEGRAIKREFKEQTKAIKQEAKDLRRRTIGR
jgi:DNA-binding MarR family transcriptional regulator